MAEVALWTVAFTVVTAISILLTGSRALIGGTIDLMDGFGPEERPGAIFRVWCPLPHPEPRKPVGRGG